MVGERKGLRGGKGRGAPHPEGVFEANAGEAVGLDDEAPALVVEVVHDALEAAVLLTQEVLHGDLSEPQGRHAGQWDNGGVRVTLHRPHWLICLDDGGSTDRGGEGRGEGRGRGRLRKGGEGRGLQEGGGGELLP